MRVGVVVEVDMASLTVVVTSASSDLPSKLGGRAAGVGDCKWSHGRSGCAVWLGTADALRSHACPASHARAKVRSPDVGSYQRAG